MESKKEKGLLECIYCKKKITWEESMELLGDGFGTCRECGNKLDNYIYGDDEYYFKDK